VLFAAARCIAQPAGFLVTLAVGRRAPTRHAYPRRAVTRRPVS
jgi:hypothetical protein